MIAEYLVGILEGAGYLPLQAATLAEARRQLVSCHIDLCLCDRHLPDGDSVELLPAMAGIPAILLTAGGAEVPHSRLIAAGFAHVLLKPCEPERLCQVIARTLAQARPASPSAGSVPADAPGHGPLLAPARPAPADVAPADLPVLDDGAALSMCGDDAEAMVALRRLLVDELPPIRQAVARLAVAGPQQRHHLAGELHKLAASAAWCGASELAHHCDRLQRELTAPGPEAGSDTRDGVAGMLAALDRLARALP